MIIKPHHPSFERASSSSSAAVVASASASYSQIIENHRRKHHPDETSGESCGSAGMTKRKNKKNRSLRRLISHRGRLPRLCGRKSCEKECETKSKVQIQGEAESFSSSSIWGSRGGNLATRARRVNEEGGSKLRRGAVTCDTVNDV